MRALVVPDHQGRCSMCKRTTMVETVEPTAADVVGLLAEGVPKDRIKSQDVCLRCANAVQRQLESEHA